MYFIFNRFFFPKSCHLCDNVGKYNKVGQVTDDNIKRLMRIACCINETTDILSKYEIINDFSRP
jgi:predicted metal-binding protein